MECTLWLLAHSFSSFGCLGLESSMFYGLVVRTLNIGVKPYRYLLWQLVCSWLLRNIVQVLGVLLWVSLMVVFVFSFCYYYWQRCYYWYSYYYCYCYCSLLQLYYYCSVIAIDFELLVIGYSAHRVLTLEDMWVSPRAVPLSFLFQ